eukprot:scaffold134123_cov32-Tisochrysis_lutea.AAC.6
MDKENATSRGDGLPPSHNIGAVQSRSTHYYADDVELTGGFTRKNSSFTFETGTSQAEQSLR